MLFDGRAASAPGYYYDIVVVGAGPAGITTALELSGAGLKIALIESGGLTFDAATQALHAGEVTGLEEIDLIAARLRMLGGTSNHWGGFCLPLDPVDFDRPPLSGKAGWPISRRDLLDVYPRAHRYLDLGAFNYDPAALPGYGEAQFLLPENDLVEISAMRLSAGPPTNFGVKYRDALTAAPDIDLWLWTNLVGIQLGDTGIVESVATRTLTGIERSFTGRRIVLACGAVENARQLLLLNRRRPGMVGGTGDHLGACYMDHLSGGAAFLWPRSLLTSKAEWSDAFITDGDVPVRYVWRLRDEVQVREGLANAHFYLVPFSSNTEARLREQEASSGMSGIRSLAKWAIGRGEPNTSLSEAYCSFVVNADAMVANLMLPPGDTDRVLLRYEAEQQPDSSSRVSLSQGTDALGLPLPTLHWSPSELDRRSLLRTVELVGQAVGAADIGRLELEKGYDQPYWNFTTAWHQLGTTRMAASPADGVVDADCLTRGTRNLYVAGGSVMPTGGRANPTLTITALAIRLADHIKLAEGIAQ